MQLTIILLFFGGILFKLSKGLDILLILVVCFGERFRERSLMF
jgi:hypothetical protein